MLKSEECTILSLDNAEKVVEMTGMSLSEISEIYRRNIYQGNKQIYWQRDDRWFSLSVNGRYIDSWNNIDPFVLDMMDKHSRLKPPT